MSACEQTLVYTTAAPSRDFTAEIAAADSPEDQRKLLAEKQAALHAGRPSRPLAIPEIAQVVQFETVQAGRAPVKKHPHTGPYAHGMSMAATLEKVCMRQGYQRAGQERGRDVIGSLPPHPPHARTAQDAHRAQQENRGASLGRVEGPRATHLEARQVREGE